MEEIEKPANTETICCDGGQDGLGHPQFTIVLIIKTKLSVVCGKIYIKEKVGNMYKNLGEKNMPMCSKQYYDLGRAQLICLNVVKKLKLRCLDLDEEENLVVLMRLL